MFTVNPCILFENNPRINFNRNLLLLLIIADLGLVALLRLLSIFFRNRHNDMVKDIVRKIKEKDVIRVQEIKIELHEQSDATINSKKGLPTNPKTKQKELSQQTESSESSNDEEEEEEVEKQKYIVHLKKLKINQGEFVNILAINFGIKFVSISFLIIYYPFMVASLIVCIQFVMSLMQYFLKICGYSGKLLSFLEGTNSILNIGLLGLAIYGLEKRVPKYNSPYCFDL